MKNAAAVGCLIAPFVLFFLCAGCIFTFQRTQYIDRGFRLSDHRSGDFTFDAWSSGEWRSGKEGMVYVSTLSPPYTLLISVLSKKNETESINVISAKATFTGGEVVDLLPFLLEKKGVIIERGKATIRGAYGELQFNNALPKHESVEIELELETTSGDKASRHRHTFKIPAYEERTNSLYFWDVMSSV